MLSYEKLASREWPRTKEKDEDKEIRNAVHGKKTGTTKIRKEVTVPYSLTMVPYHTDELGHNPSPSFPRLSMIHGAVKASCVVFILFRLTTSNLCPYYLLLLLGVVPNFNNKMTLLASHS